MFQLLNFNSISILIILVGKFLISIVNSLVKLDLCMRNVMLMVQGVTCFITCYAGHL